MSEEQQEFIVDEVTDEEVLARLRDVCFQHPSCAPFPVLREELVRFIGFSEDGSYGVIERVCEGYPDSQPRQWRFPRSVLEVWSSRFKIDFESAAESSDPLLHLLVEINGQLTWVLVEAWVCGRSH